MGLLAVILILIALLIVVCFLLFPLFTMLIAASGNTKASHNQADKVRALHALAKQRAADPATARPFPTPETLAPEHAYWIDEFTYYCHKILLMSHDPNLPPSHYHPLYAHLTIEELRSVLPER